MAEAVLGCRRVRVAFIALCAMFAGAQGAYAHDADRFTLQRRLPSLEQLTPAQSARAAPVMRRVLPAPEAPAQTASSTPICDVFANGFDSPGESQCAACIDHTSNFYETAIDCGGPYCKPCDSGGQSCMVNLDCASQVCNAGTCTASKCLTGSDCMSGACNPSTFVCEPASCANGMKDGFETAVDCGGPTCGPCGDNQSCQTNFDCVSGNCGFNNTCVPASCSDLRQNGSETGVDCGGGCLGCGIGQGCKANADCASLVCSSATHTCAPSHCANTMLDADETGVDCGGSCPGCAAGTACNGNTDCASGVCSMVCVADTCSDGVKNGTETDIDCGGNTCGKCGPMQACITYLDCASNSCVDHFCH